MIYCATKNLSHMSSTASTQHPSEPNHKKLVGTAVYEWAAFYIGAEYNV